MNEQKHENSLQTATRWARNAAWTGYWIWVLFPFFKKLFGPRPDMLSLPDVQVLKARNAKLSAELAARIHTVKARTKHFRLNFDFYVNKTHPEHTFTHKLRLGHGWDMSEEGRHLRDEMQDIMLTLYEMKLPNKAQKEQRAAFIRWVECLRKEYAAYCKWSWNSGEEKRNAHEYADYCRKNGYTVPDLKRMPLSEPYTGYFLPLIDIGCYRSYFRRQLKDELAATIPVSAPTTAKDTAILSVVGAVLTLAVLIGGCWLAVHFNWKF